MKNLSIGDKLFKERSPGMTVKRRLRNIHWPILQKILEAERSGTPPKDIPPARFRIILSFAEKVWQRVSESGIYMPKEQRITAVLSDRATQNQTIVTGTDTDYSLVLVEVSDAGLTTVRLGANSYESSLKTLILDTEKASQNNTVGNGALPGAGFVTDSMADTGSLGISFSSGEYFLPRFTEYTNATITWDESSYVLASIPVDAQAEAAGATVAWEQSYYVSAIHPVTVSDTVGINAIVESLTAGVVQVDPAHAETSGISATVESLNVNSVIPGLSVTEIVLGTGEFTGGSYS